MTDLDNFIKFLEEYDISFIKDLRPSKPEIHLIIKDFRYHSVVFNQDGSLKSKDRGVESFFEHTTHLTEDLFLSIKYYMKENNKETHRMGIIDPETLLGLTIKVKKFKDMDCFILENKDG